MAVLSLGMDRLVLGEVESYVEKSTPLLGWVAAQDVVPLPPAGKERA